MLPRVSTALARNITRTNRVAPVVQKRFFGDPHADTGAEAAAALKLWKYVACGVFVPSAVAFAYFNFFEEHEQPIDLPKMPYKGIVIKKFPWGDGNLSLFAMWYQDQHAHDHEHEH